MSEIKNRSVFYSHTVSLSAFFVIGQFIITLPFLKTLNSFFGFLISAVAGVFAWFLTSWLINTVLNVNFKPIKVLVLGVFSVFSAFVLAETFKTFCAFARNVFFKDVFSVSIVLSFLCVCSIFVLSKEKNVLKFSLIAFIYSAIVILIFIILLLPNFKINNLWDFENIEFENITDVFKQYFLNIFLSVVLLNLFQTETFFGNKRNAVVWGVSLGALILTVCGICCVLLFGSGFVGAIQYPLVSAVSTVSVGKLFSRLDAFFYFVFFFACLLRIAVCGCVIKQCFKNINKNLT